MSCTLYLLFLQGKLFWLLYSQSDIQIYKFQFSCSDSWLCILQNNYSSRPLEGFHLQSWARLWSWDWDWDLGGLGLKPWDHLFKVSVSVSILETKVRSLSLSLKIWDQREKSQSQTLIPSTKSLGLSLKKEILVSHTHIFFSKIYYWSSTTWVPYFFQISLIWPNLEFFNETKYDRF